VLGGLVMLGLGMAVDALTYATVESSESTVARRDPETPPALPT